MDGSKIYKTKIIEIGGIERFLKGQKYYPSWLEPHSDHLAHFQSPPMTSASFRLLSIMNWRVLSESIVLAGGRSASARPYKSIDPNLTVFTRWALLTRSNRSQSA